MVLYQAAPRLQKLQGIKVHLTMRIIPGSRSVFDSCLNSSVCFEKGQRHEWQIRSLANEIAKYCHS